MRYLPYTVAILELGAGLVYCYFHEWRLAVVWTAVGVANLAFAGVR